MDEECEYPMLSEHIRVSMSWGVCIAKELRKRYEESKIRFGW